MVSYLMDILKNGPKTPKNIQRRESLSRNVFTFLKTWKIITKIGPKLLKNAPQQRDTCCKIFLGTFSE